MKTTELIADLADGLRPVRPGAAMGRLALGAALGAAAAAAVLAVTLGAPFAAVAATGVPAFAMKLFFAVSLAAIAWTLLALSGLPGRDVGRRSWWLLVPVAIAAVAAIAEQAALTPVGRTAAVLGGTWSACLAAVAVLAVPVFLGIAWGVGALAPTRLKLTGFLAGIAAGTLSAILYACYCPETTASFLAVWYVLGIAIAGAFGRLAGPFLLRW